MGQAWYPAGRQRRKIFSDRRDLAKLARRDGGIEFLLEDLVTEIVSKLSPPKSSQSFASGSTFAGSTWSSLATSGTRTCRRPTWRTGSRSSGGARSDQNRIKARRASRRQGH